MSGHLNISETDVPKPTDSPGILVDGDGKRKENGAERAKPASEMNRENTTSLEYALSLVETLDQIAIVGAPSVIPNRDLADFLSRKLAKSIAYHPGVRNGAYIRELVDNGFAKRNAQKIVWTARKLSRSMPVDTTVIRAFPDESTPATRSGSVPALASAPIPETPSPKKHKPKRGISLWKDYNEMFKGYEKHKYKRPTTQNNPEGLYMGETDERKKYGAFWSAVGFEMVPEDLPRILPVLKETGLLDVYKADPAVVQEIEEEREKMLAAGVDMRLAAPPKNVDQARPSPIDHEQNLYRNDREGE
jgi:hypothetical protein